MMNEQLNQIRQRIDILDHTLILHIIEYQKNLFMLNFQTEEDFESLYNIILNSLNSVELDKKELDLINNIFQIISKNILQSDIIKETDMLDIHLKMLTHSQKNIFFTILQRNCCIVKVKKIKQTFTIPAFDSQRKESMMQTRKNLCQNQLDWQEIEKIFNFLHEYSVNFQQQE